MGIWLPARGPGGPTLKVQGTTMTGVSMVSALGIVAMVWGTYFTTGLLRFLQRGLKEIWGNVRAI